MSMTIPDAYLYKKNADFNDLTQCVYDLTDLKKQYRKWLINEFVEHKYMHEDIYPTGDYHKDWENCHKLAQEIHDKSQCVERGVGFDISFDATVYCREMNGVNFIVVQFFPATHAQDFLRQTKPIKWPEYWFTNQCEDGCEDIPDYEERRDFYENHLFEKSRIPSENGFSFELISISKWEIFHLLHDVQEKLEEKIKKESKNDK